MMSIMRKRREAERAKKLEDVFREADVNNSGKITTEQLVKLFHANDVFFPNLEEEVRKLAGEDGEVRYSEFMKFATPTDLCKIDHVRGGFAKAEDPDQKAAKKEAKKSSAAKEKDTTVTQPDTEKSCAKGGGEQPKGKKHHADAERSRMDKVELAFRKFDTNKDGYLSRDEFDQMMKDVDKVQADRIFRTCDAAGDGRISLQEFRRVLEKGREPAQHPKST